MTVYCSLLHRRIISMKRKGIGRDRLPYTESPARFLFFQIPRTQKIGTRFSASADFVTLSLLWFLAQVWRKSAFARSKNQGFMRFFGSY